MSEQVENQNVGFLMTRLIFIYHEQNGRELFIECYEKDAQILNYSLHVSVFNLHVDPCPVSPQADFPLPWPEYHNAPKFLDR